MFKGEIADSRLSKKDLTIKDLKIIRHYYEPALITSRKMAVGSNAGNTLLGDCYEVTMSPIESFQHSKVGQVVGKAVERVIYRAKK